MHREVNSCQVDIFCGTFSNNVLRCAIPQIRWLLVNFKFHKGGYLLRFTSFSSPSLPQTTSLYQGNLYGGFRCIWLLMVFMLPICSFYSLWGALWMLSFESFLPLLYQMWLLQVFDFGVHSSDIRLKIHISDIRKATFFSSC